MAALQLPQYGIDKLYLYPYYMTTDAYKAATGKDAPAFDPSKPPKHWEDTAAASSTSRVVVYARALVQDAKGTYEADSDGRPRLDALALSKTEAATVNIPPAGYSVEGSSQVAVPVPLRELAEDEELVFGFANVPVVRNKKLFANVANGFTVEDRAVLCSIAAKLGL